MKQQRIVIGHAQSAQHEPGILIPENATVVKAELDPAGEHGYVDFYTSEVVDVDEDESEASSDDGR